MYNLRTVNKYKPPKGLHPAVKDSEEILKDKIKKLTIRPLAREVCGKVRSFPKQIAVYFRYT